VFKLVEDACRKQLKSAKISRSMQVGPLEKFKNAATGFLKNPGGLEDLVLLAQSEQPEQHL
jgi:hypothetical protein